MNRGGAWPFRPELLVLTLFGLGSFGFPGLGGGGGLHKSESIDAIDLKLGG